MAVVRHTKNPFLAGFMVETRGKQVAVTALGAHNNVEVVNRNTGEVQGTQVVTYKKVDSAEFVKLFAKNIALTFDLGSAGIKAFNVVIWQVQTYGMNTDMLTIDSLTMGEFNRYHEKTLSIATLKRGLGELEKAKIIAKAARRGQYYINPNFVFNGNRIIFSTCIERDTSQD